MILPIDNLDNNKKIAEKMYAKSSTKKTKISTKKGTDTIKNMETKSVNSKSVNSTKKDSNAALKSTNTSNVLSTNNGILSVNTVDLSAVPISLKNKRDDILRVYNSQIKNIIETSKEAIVVSGINFEELDLYFSKAFTTLSNELDNLANVLQNQILPRYDNLSESIRNAFNNEFASQMQSIMNSLK